MDVLITEDLVADSISALAKKYEVVTNPKLWSDPSLSQRLAVARTVMIRNQTKITHQLLEAAPKLLAIGRVGVGLDNIDLEAANDKGVVVIAPLGVNALSVAEFTIGIILSLARRIPLADRSTKAGGWDRRGCTGIELQGKTIGILGFGRIGMAVAVLGNAFGLRKLIYDPYIDPGDPRLRKTTSWLIPNLIDVIREADFLSIHLPLMESTKGLIDAKALSALKPTAYIINAARGGIVDETALLAALENKTIAGAALDVRETEPPIGLNPFAKFDNVILTPHIGSFTHEAQTRTFEAVCADLDRILRGEPAQNFVNFAQPRK